MKVKKLKPSQKYLILKDLGRKPNKVQVGNGSNFHKKSILWLPDKDIEIYSMYDGGNSVVAERFPRNWNNKINKNITAISKKGYIHKVLETGNEDNNVTHRTIKIKPVDIKPINFDIFKLWCWI